MRSHIHSFQRFGLGPHWVGHDPAHHAAKQGSPHREESPSPRCQQRPGLGKPAGGDVVTANIVKVKECAGRGVAALGVT